MPTNNDYKYLIWVTAPDVLGQCSTILEEPATGTGAPHIVLQTNKMTAIYVTTNNTEIHQKNAIMSE